MTRFPERVREARLLVGVTQEQLAGSSGVPQSLISMIERGDRSLTSETADALIKSLGLPSEFLEVAPSTIPDGAIDFRKLKTASTKDTARAKVLFKEAHRAAAQLLTSSSYPAPTLPLVQDRESPLGPERIEELALSVREHLQLDISAPVANVTRALERRGVAVVPLVVPTSDDDVATTPGHFGASHWAGVHEPAVLTYFPSQSGDRDRFTLMHELAHVVLHTFRQHVPQDMREIEANALASALLFPMDRAWSALSPDATLRQLAELKARWGLSMQALIMRGKYLGILTEARSSSLFRQIGARGWRKKEPVEVPQETPILLSTIIERLYGPNPYRSERIEKELALPAAIIRSMAPQLSKSTAPGERLDNVRHVVFGRPPERRHR